MDYHAIYNRIIDNARDRDIEPGIYYEQHHVIPISLGGDNSPENLVNLTSREHFICHALLVKMNSGQARHKMLYAFNAMRMNNKYQQRVTSRLYEYFKHELHDIYRSKMLENNPMHNPKSRAKHATAMKKRNNVGMSGRKHSAETLEKMRLARSNQTITDETKRKLSEYRKQASQDPDYINGCRLGWYITPWGKFKGYDAAAVGQPCSAGSVRSWCRINNTKKVTPQSVKPGGLFTKNDIGKTFAELGFGFEEL